MLQVVINIDSLMRGGVCGRLHGGLSHLFALQQSSIDSQLSVENWDLCLPICIRRPRRNIAMTLGVEKLEWCGYPTVIQF